MANIVSIAPINEGPLMGVAGQELTMRLAVGNLSGETMTIGLSVLPESREIASWLQLQGRCELTLEPRATATVEVRFRPPSDAAPGIYRFQLLVYSVTAPEDDYTVGPNVAITIAAPTKSLEGPAPTGDVFGHLLHGIVTTTRNLFRWRRHDAKGTADSVDIAAFGPGSIAAGAHFILDVWAYPTGEFDRVRELAAQVDRADELGRKVGLHLERGTLLEIELELDGLGVKRPQASLTWYGTPTNVSFAVFVPNDTSPSSHAGFATLRVDGIKLGELPIVVTVAEAPDRTPSCYGADHKKVRTAFASYASANAEAVFARLQGIQKAAPGLDIFVDVLSLRSGDDWEARLTAEVPTKDVFYLFWSQAAAESAWVRREWSMALQRRGLKYIDPVPLQDPRDTEIPEPLRGLHFNDRFLRHIEYERRRREASVPR